MIPLGSPGRYAYFVLNEYIFDWMILFILFSSFEPNLLWTKTFCFSLHVMNFQQTTSDKNDFGAGDGVPPWVMCWISNAQLFLEKFMFQKSSPTRQSEQYFCLSRVLKLHRGLHRNAYEIRPALPTSVLSFENNSSNQRRF